MYTSPVNFITSEVSRNKVGVLENVPDIAVHRILSCQVKVNNTWCLRQISNLMEQKLKFDAYERAYEPNFNDNNAVVLLKREEIRDVHKRGRAVIEPIHVDAPKADYSPLPDMIFPNPARSGMVQLNVFHDWLMSFLIPIAITVLCVILKKGRFTERVTTDNQSLECLWIVVPSMILVFLGSPSLRLLYLFDEVDGNYMVKALGHQWYWEYDRDFCFDSYMRGTYRLLRTDNRLYTPALVGSMLISSCDVLHSWAIPTLGVKADAVPGRINKLNIIPDRAGLYFGQCSEICGANHRRIPITMECKFSYELTLKV